MGKLIRLIEKPFALLSGVQVVDEGQWIRASSPRHYADKRTLFHLSRRDPFRIADAYQHIVIMGDTGCGKSTAGGMIGMSYLQAGFGGCVLSYKEGESHRWITMAAATGRTPHMIVINPDNPSTFNLLAWELERPGRGAGSTENACDVLVQITEFTAPGGRRQVQDSHWTEGTRRLLKHSIETIRLAGLPITMRHIRKIIEGIPVTHRFNGQLHWPPGSFVQECLQRAKQRGMDTALLEGYFVAELARIGQEEHTGSVISSTTHMLDYLVSGVVAHLFFNDHPTITPDFSKHGCIYLLDLPVLEFGNAGRIGQVAFRTVWIKEMMRRQGLEGGTPAFLYMDESQQFFSPQLDNLFLEAARSSCVSACYLTQTISAWYAAAEAGRAHDQVHAAMSHLGLKLFMRNSGDTNTYASNLISKALQIRYSGGSSSSATRNHGVNSGFTSSSGSGGGGSHSSSGFSVGASRGVSDSYGTNSGWREENDALVPEEVFTRLAVGQAVAFRSGKRFALTGRPYTWVQFQPWEQARPRQGLRRWRGSR